jgi:HPt (histidine-containing phosphotransfer) domain-containing protein
MKTLNLDFLNEQFDNDEECISEILDIFVESADETVSFIKDALATKNEETLAAYAHKLKGASGTVGAEVLSNQCLIVDKLCKEHKFAEAFDEATNIPDLYKELRACII